MKPWIKTSLFMAVWMFIIMTFAIPYILPLFGLEQQPQKHPAAKIAIDAVAALVTGFWIGYRNRNNKKVKKQIDS